MRSLSIHKPKYALFGCWFLFTVPYFYPSHHFPFERVAAGEVHLLWSLIILALMSVAVAAGTTIGRAGARRGAEDPSYWRFVRRCCLAAFAIALVANAVITADAIRSIETSILQAKGSIEKFGGVNILSQTYLLFLGPFIWASSVLGRRKYRWLAPLGLVLLLRAVFMSERLAFLEFLIPCVVAACLTGDLRLSAKRIAAGIALFAALFVLTELTRQFYVQHAGKNAQQVGLLFVISWTFERLMAYYADTTNKLYFVLFKELSWTSQYYLYTFTRILERLSGSEFGVGSDFAGAMGGARYRDFTNPGGFTSTLTDFGILWMPFLLLYFSAFALLHGFCRKGGLFALGLYPVYFVAVLELPRFNYLFLTRFTFAFLLFLFFYVAVRAALSGHRPQQEKWWGPASPAPRPVSADA